MRNFVFIGNRNASDIIEEHLSEHTIPRASMEFTKNSKGKIMEFHSSYWAERIVEFVEDQRNMIAFDLTVLPMNQDEKREAKDTVRSLTRISDELHSIVKHFKAKEAHIANS